MNHFMQSMVSFINVSAYLRRLDGHCFRSSVQLWFPWHVIGNTIVIVAGWRGNSLRQKRWTFILPWLPHGLVQDCGQITHRNFVCLQPAFPQLPNMEMYGKRPTTEPRVLVLLANSDCGMLGKCGWVKGGSPKNGDTLAKTSVQADFFPQRMKEVIQCDWSMQPQCIFIILYVYIYIHICVCRFELHEVASYTNKTKRFESHGKSICSIMFSHHFEVSFKFADCILGLSLGRWWITIMGQQMMTATFEHVNVSVKLRTFNSTHIIIYSIYI